MNINADTATFLLGMLVNLLALYRFFKENQEERIKIRERLTAIETHIIHLLKGQENEIHS